MRRLHAAAFCGATAALLIASGPAFGQAATTPKGKGEATTLSNTVQNAASSGDAGTQTGSGTSGGLVRTIVGLLIVIAVIYGVTWVLKQVKNSREEQAIGGGLESTASLPLGPGRTVHLVRAGTEYLLLGVTDGGVQPLRTYSAEEARAAGFPTGDEVDGLRPEGKAAGGDAATFMNRVRDLTVRR